jgi:adenylosuccinate lyase
MTVDRTIYENPLALRYASREMNWVWSPQNKFQTWRQLWVALAKAEKEFGLKITDEQIAELEAHITDIDFELAEKKEKELRHDVMSHVHAYGELCPKARGIIHLGATSCYVGDNTDLMQMREALGLIRGKLVLLLEKLSVFANTNKAVPTLGFTHFQPAQLTTVGKRATLWMYDLLLDLENVEARLKNMPFRGVKGTTGTQASFLELFDGDHAKVEALDARVAEMMGFPCSVPVSGQTYTRKFDYFILSILSGIAQSASKMGNDVRLLSHLKEVEEPFEKNQIGSSAMAYKRNPMRSERVCSLSRYVISLVDNTAYTHATQWFERTLDDSANRRLSIPEAFLATDIILTTLINVAGGLQVWPKIIEKRLRQELPFMATENIIMECVKAGGDRQDLHEGIRKHSMEASRRVKEEGADNQLLDLLKQDPMFKPVHAKLDKLLDPKLFIGRSPEQVDSFLKNHVAPAIARNRSTVKAAAGEVNV